MRTFRFVNFSYDAKTFAANCKQARKGRGLSQQQVATILSVSKSTISLWENDKGHPTIDNFLALCWLYDFHPVAFLVVKNGEGLKSKEMFTGLVKTEPIAVHTEVFEGEPYVVENAVNG